MYSGTAAQHSSDRDAYAVDASLSSLMLRYLETCLALVGVPVEPTQPRHSVDFAPHLVNG